MIHYSIKEIGGRERKVSKSAYYRAKAKLANPRVTVYLINGHPIARELVI